MKSNRNRSKKIGLTSKKREKNLRSKSGGKPVKKLLPGEESSLIKIKIKIHQTDQKLSQVKLVLNYQLRKIFLLVNPAFRTKLLIRDSKNKFKLIVK